MLFYIVHKIAKQSQHEVAFMLWDRNSKVYPNQQEMFTMFNTAGGYQRLDIVVFGGRLIAFYQPHRICNILFIVPAACPTLSSILITWDRRMLLASLFDCVKKTLDWIGFPVVSADFGCAKAVTASYHSHVNFHTDLRVAVAVGKMFLTSPDAVLNSTHLKVVPVKKNSLLGWRKEAISLRYTLPSRIVNLLSHAKRDSSIPELAQSISTLPGVPRDIKTFDLSVLRNLRFNGHIEHRSEIDELLNRVRQHLMPSIATNARHRTKEVRPLTLQCINQLKQGHSVFLLRPPTAAQMKQDIYLCKAEFESALSRDCVFDIMHPSITQVNETIKVQVVQHDESKPLSKKNPGKRYGQYLMYKMK
jgi:hypothetical protein